MDRRVHRVISTLSALVTATPRGNSPIEGAGVVTSSESALIKQLAQAVNLSPSRLRARFKAETGLTPKQQLNQLRMERAKQLAETTFKTIDQILVEVGVTDASHFRRKFKQTYGLTLNECRQRQNETQPPEAVKQRPRSKRPANS